MPMKVECQTAYGDIIIVGGSNVFYEFLIFQVCLFPEERFIYIQLQHMVLWYAKAVFQNTLLAYEWDDYLSQWSTKMGA